MGSDPVQRAILEKRTEIPFNKPFIAGKELYYVTPAVNLGNLAGDGYFTQQCCRTLEERFRIGKVLLVPSCTAALEMAAMLFDLEPGDEVILPSFTFVSTANAVARLGARPVFVDIRPDTLNIDDALIEEAITPPTRALFPVHHAGVGCAMDWIMTLADQYNLLVAEDAAQGVNAYYQERALGSIGHLGCYDPAMMTCLLLYANCVGVFSSRKIARACERNLAFLAIVGRERPDFRTISLFRKTHLEAFADVFVQILLLAKAAGLVRLGTIAIDGTKVQGNASRHKAMSYGYRTQEVARLRAEIDQLLTQAQDVDAEGDAVLGTRRGDELPEGLRRREDRLATIDAAMKRLEAEAKAAADAERRRRGEAEAERQRTGKKQRGRAPGPIVETASMSPNLPLLDSTTETQEKPIWPQRADRRPMKSSTSPTPMKA